MPDAMSSIVIAGPVACSRGNVVHEDINAANVTWDAKRKSHRAVIAFPFHEPTHPRPLPGGEQASVRVLSVPLLGGARGGFMVPMHAEKRSEAFHEPPISDDSVPGARQHNYFFIASDRILRLRKDTCP